MTFQEVAEYISMRITLKNYKELIEKINTPSVISNHLKKYAEDGLKAYNKKDGDWFKVFEELYQFARDRLKELGKDISKYPETLEELTKTVHCCIKGS